jgi:hypothetical protein
VTPSHYQLAVFDQVAAAVKAKQQRRPFRHVVVQASAGSGKTTLCVELCSRIAPARCTVVAFGTRNADELKKKLPSNAEASTLHSLGNRAWTQTLGGRQYAPEIAVGGHSRPGKLDRIIGAEVEAGRIPRWLRYKVAKLVDLARMHGIVPGSRRTQQDAQGEAFADPDASWYHPNHDPNHDPELDSDRDPDRGLKLDRDCDLDPGPDRDSVLDLVRDPVRDPVRNPILAVK